MENSPKSKPKTPKLFADYAPEECSLLNLVAEECHQQRQQFVTCQRLWSYQFHRNLLINFHSFRPVKLT